MGFRNIIKRFLRKYKNYDIEILLP